jgi:hypothetical protein
VHEPELDTVAWKLTGWRFKLPEAGEHPLGRLASVIPPVHELWLETVTSEVHETPVGVHVQL